jgi:hypothetical protein
MANSFAARPMDEVREELLDRAKGNRNPFLYTIYDEVAPVINGLRSVDRGRVGESFQCARRASCGAGSQSRDSLATHRRQKKNI